MEVDMASIFEV